jgi:hypothetical protein
MKSVFICLIGLMVIFLQVSTAFAVSPMPSEFENEIERKSLEKVKHPESDTVCNVDVFSAGDIPYNNTLQKKSLFFAFDKSVDKKDVFDEIIKLIEKDIERENITKVSIECNFKK